MTAVDKRLLTIRLNNEIRQDPGFAQRIGLIVIRRGDKAVSQGGATEDYSIGDTGIIILD